MTPEQRVLRSRLGGLTTAARGHTNVGPAHAPFASRFYAGIPDDLPQAERDRRAHAAKRAYFTRLALASSRARSKKPALVIETAEDGRGDVDRGDDNPTAE